MVTQGIENDTEMRGLIDRLDEAETKRLLLAELQRLAGLGT